MSTLAASTLVRRFRANRIGFLEAHRWFVALFLLALLADAASTTYFLLARPGEEELHPVVSLAIQLGGPVAGPLVGFFGKAIPGLVVAIYLRAWAKPILLSAAAISFFAAWYNIWGVYFV